MSDFTVTYRYPDAEDEQINHTDRGWRQGIVVTFTDGRQYELEAYSPQRLLQDIETEFANGEVVVVQPHALIVPEVTLAAIQLAVEALSKTGAFFRRIAPKA